MTSAATMPRPLVRSDRVLWPPLDRRATRARARARLHAELRSIVLDLLGPCEPDELSAEAAAWVENAAAIAVSAVGDRSMRALIESLEATVAQAPRDVIHRLDEAAVRHDAGIA